MPSYQKYAKSVGLPRMVKCYTCKRAKEIEEFAPAEQNNLRRLTLGSGPIPEDHGAQCRICKNTPRGITCFACNRDLEESCFNKTQRKKDEPICERCVAWEETQQPGYTPTPLVNGHISAEEVPDIINRQQKTDADFYLDDEDDDELPTIQTPRGDARSISHLTDGVSDFDLNAEPSNSECQSSNSMNQVWGQPGVAPRRWGGNSRHDLSGDTRSVYTTSTTNTKETTSTQKLARGLPQNLNRRDQGVRSSIPTVSTATTVRDDKSDFSRGTKGSFNAWDPRGVQHRRKNEAEESSMASTEASSTNGASKQNRQTSKWQRKSHQNDDMW